MSDQDGTAWLRAQIEADLAAAKIISAGGFAPELWDTEPPGQVNPGDIPQGDAVTAALGCAPEYICGWVQVVAYDKFSDEPDEAYQRDSGAPFALVDNGRREVDHIIRNDPRNVVARCEAELAILDEHARLLHFPAETLAAWRTAGVPEDRIAKASGVASCARCHTPVDDAREDEDQCLSVAYPCRTVRLLASGYRHKSGYEEAWKA